MKIRIAGVEIDKWQNLSVTLVYDSVKSIFSFDLWWNPFDAKMREVMLPCAYHQCLIIADNGERVLTGVMHSPSFEDSEKPCLVNISGYSITGVLDDCPYYAIFPGGTQNQNLTFLQICQNMCDHFGFGLVDKTDGAAAAAKLKSTDTDKDNSCTDYIKSIAQESKITVSHDAAGNLVLSISKETSPVFDFVSGMPGIKINLSFDGQKMHSNIIAATQGGATQQESISNPYVKKDSNLIWMNAAFNSTVGAKIKNEYSAKDRPGYVVQSNSDDSLKQTAADELMDELKAIPVTVKMNGWVLGNKIPRPENIITILSPRCYLFNKTKFFVQSVAFTGDEEQGTAILNCVVPEAFNGKTPINIFTNQGNNTNFKDAPAEGGTIIRSQDRKGPNL